MEDIKNRNPEQCAKAVRDFWNNERKLIKQGQGTRNWTTQEQIEIMNFKPSGGERKNAAAPTYGQGKSSEYGMNYSKYEGQHMKSAEAYPNYQDDCNNIQALRRDEHQQAHNGDFRNPTNWYYNPENGHITNFGNNAPKKIQPQWLSEAYVNSSEYKHISNSTNPTIVPGLDTYRQRKTEAQNPTHYDSQNVLSKFEQSKADMQNLTQLRNNESLQKFERQKSKMQDNGNKKDNSINQPYGEEAGEAASILF